MLLHEQPLNKRWQKFHIKGQTPINFSLLFWLGLTTNETLHDENLDLGDRNAKIKAIILYHEQWTKIDLPNFSLQKRG